MEKTEKTLRGRSLELTAEETKIAYILLNVGPNGNSVKELRLIGGAMDDIEAQEVDNPEKPGEKLFGDTKLVIPEAVYNILKSRLEQSKNWGGSARKAVLGFEDKLENAEKVEKTAEG